MSDTAPELLQEQVLRYQTRFHATADADRILPFVLEALRTVGFGSACVVRGGALDADAPAVLGIQWTAPIDEALLIEAQIRALDALADPLYRSSRIYPPVRELTTTLAPETFEEVVANLGVIPPHISVQCLRKSDDVLLIVFAGPAVDDIEDDFRDRIFPNIAIFLKSFEPVL